MALDDYELNLQTEIVNWKCSRYADCNMKFIRRPRHIKLGMRGLVWSIEALPLQNPSEYSFNIMHVKRSDQAPLLLSEASAPPNLPAKFEILLEQYKESMESVRRMDEALDKLYAFSRLFSLAGEDKRWWIVVDAAIMATACESAKEALHEAAQAAAAILVVDQVNSPVSGGRQQRESSERSGRWIDKWTLGDELWATGFFPRDGWKCSTRMIQATAVENGNVFQWCRVRTFDEPNPNFQFEVAVHEFLEGDDVLLRIGVANDRPLTVRVFLTESVEVVCSQEGLETGTSLGLGYLLPGTAKEYIRSALGRNEAALTDKNVVEALLGHLIRYLAFLGNICVICGHERLSDVPRSSTCRDICKARKQRYEDAIARVLAEMKISETERASRRERYVRNLYKNTTEGRSRLGNLLGLVVVDEPKREKRSDDGLLCYEDAVGRVTIMKSRSIALALQIPVSDLWIDDAESF